MSLITPIADTLVSAEVRLQQSEQGAERLGRRQRVPLDCILTSRYMTEGERVVIHHVQLACPAGSEAVLRAFYSGVLGLDEIDKPPALAPRGGCWFRGYGFELHLGVEADFKPARKAPPALLVSGIDDWASRLAAAGHPVSFDEGFPGMRRFYSSDPH